VTPPSRAPRVSSSFPTSAHHPISYQHHRVSFHTAAMSSPSPVAKVAPSVLASDFGNLTAECTRMIKNGADWLHMGAPPAAGRGRMLEREVGRLADGHSTLLLPADIMDGLAGALFRREKRQCRA
jgi:hypothetical protein